MLRIFHPHSVGLGFSSIHPLSRCRMERINYKLYSEPLFIDCEDWLGSVSINVKEPEELECIESVCPARDCSCKWMALTTSGMAKISGA